MVQSYLQEDSYLNQKQFFLMRLQEKFKNISTKQVLVKNYKNLKKHMED